MTGTELATTDKSLLQVQKIHQATVKWSDQLSAADAASETLVMVRAIRELRGLMTEEIVAEIDELRGSSLGFLTDKDSEPKPYSLDVIRDVWLKASLCGARMVNGEVFICKGRLYLTKEFYLRKFREMPGLEDFLAEPSIPKPVSERSATMTVVVRYKLNGAQREHVVSVNAKLSAGWTDEMIQGKGIRKALDKIYPMVACRRVPFSVESDDDATIIDAECHTISQVDPREAGNDRQAEQDAGKAHAAVEGEQWPEGGEELVEAFTKRLKEAKTKEQLNAIWRLMSDAQNAKRLTVGQASGMWKLYQDKIRAGE